MKQSAGKDGGAFEQEVLVAAGELVMAAAKKAGRGSCLPVDSEHNAVHQCLRGGTHGEVRRLVLTASGGPFSKDSAGGAGQCHDGASPGASQLADGNRITIDSATMMNKGFEIIEARWLFGMRPEQIERGGAFRSPRSIPWWSS